jgi:hypothetical protein
LLVALRTSSRNSASAASAALLVFLRRHVGHHVTEPAALRSHGDDPGLAVVVGRLRRGFRFIRPLLLRGTLAVSAITSGPPNR